jgi:hypothetical protein
MWTDSEPAVRELDHRSGDGIDVSLLWESGSNRVFLAVTEWQLDVCLRLEVRAADALDAFRDPYAYIHMDPVEDALAA